MRLIRGASGSGKTALVLREFTAAHREGRAPLRIVVPTATLVRHYQHELARAGLVFNPGLIVSLSRFAQDCVPHLSSATPALVRALTRDALSRLPLPEFAEVAATQGMTDIVIETITRFENAGCTPERLGKVRSLSAHGKAFLRVWKDVDAAIAARGFVTRGEIFRQATKSVIAATVWFDGFLKFSPLEADFLHAVAAACDPTLTLTDTPATQETYRLAVKLGASDQLLPPIPSRAETLAVIAPSPLREADEIARHVLELNRRGTPFPGIAVALRDVDSWLPLLRSAFDRFGIPARYYFSTPVGKHPAALFLNGLIRCALNDWDFTSTLATLRAHPAWGHSADFDRFDYKVRETMPGHGAEAFLSLCESETLRAQLADCLKIDAWRNDRLRPAVWQHRFEQLAASLYRVRTIPAPTDYAAIETARSHAAALRAWSTAVETAAASRADTPVSLEQFHAVVSDALESTGMQVPDDRNNVVHVMSAFEARQWRVRTLFVCGMTAKDYPRPVSQNLLFPDAEVENLRRAGIPLSDEGKDEEQLFELLRTRASENLILTVATHDAAGKTIVPSRHLPPAVHTHLCAPPVGQASACPPQKPLSTDILPALATQHATVGLTALEDLLKCRFRFFANRTMKLTSMPDRPEERLQWRVRGLIFHEAMETWLADRTRNFVELFETSFDNYVRRYNIPQGYKLEVERIESRRIAQEVNASVHWPVVSSEAEVECSIDFPGGITVKGRVDRIDNVGGGNCVIVDYKSGKVENVDKLIESETSLQGPLYALAVREKKNLNPVAMVFLAIREGKPVGWGEIPGANLELNPMPPDWIDSARDRTIARLESFLAGDVHAEPHNASDCLWCDFKGACRITQPDGAELIQVEVAGG